VGFFFEQVYGLVGWWEAAALPPPADVTRPEIRSVSFRLPRPAICVSLSAYLVSGHLPNLHASALIWPLWRVFITFCRSTERDVMGVGAHCSVFI